MKRKIAVLATASSSGEIGGAERFYQGLCDALRECGADVQMVSVISDESSFDSILESYLRFYDLDLSRFDGVISTKAPSYVVRHPNHVCYLLHTMRVFYDMFDTEFPWAGDELKDQRRRIQELDTVALANPGMRKLLVIGEEVRERLRQYNGLDAEVLYPATNITEFRDGPFSYVFLPGRLHRWKRVHLVISAMKYVKAPVKLLISGTGEDGESLLALAENDSRITFLGRLSDSELLDHYSNALVVPFVPCREDFGLVAIEAFHSGKPVITCEDSGEPTRLVRKFAAGIVCDPDPQSIGAAVDRLYYHPQLAIEMGSNGKSAAAAIGWESVARRLMRALGFES